MSAGTIVMLALVVLAGVAGMLVIYFGAQARREKERADQAVSEVQARQEIAEKVEVIKNEQIENIDNAGNFNGSLDVLSNIAAKRARNNLPDKADTGN